MKAKRFFSNLIILVLFGGFVFFRGWIQFSVKPGTCAILESKTGGLHPVPVEAGKFFWRWENLLPTNLSLKLFHLSPKTYVQSAGGTLAGGEVYGSWLPKKTDFSYSLKAEFTFSATPEAIHSMYSENKFQDESEFDQYLENLAKKACDILVSDMISGSATKNAAYYDDDCCRQLLSGLLGDVSLVSVSVLDYRFPDLAAYEEAKKIHSEYMATLSSQMKAKAADQAEKLVAQEKNMSQLEKLGALIERYPNLQELFQTTDMTKILNSIKEL